MADLIKAERATIRFVDGLEVDGYQMPDGEFRVSITGASELLGYQDNWLGRAMSRGGRVLKALQGIGFTEQIQKVVLKSGRPPETISIKDFNRLIVYAVSDGKKPAMALQMALTEMALTDFFRDGFGQTPLSIEEKRAAFYTAYAAAINWLEEDKDENLDLSLGMSQWH